MNDSILLLLEPTPHFLFPSPSSTKSVRLDLELKTKKDAGTKNDLLYKALGKEKNNGKSVLDATGGLLRDSAHMSSLGFQVTALEKHPLLFRGMDRVIKNVESPIRLINADAFEYLQSSDVFYDIIYLDPMFPESTGSALSGKEAQLLQLLAGHGNEEENYNLLELAISKAKSRVIIKRPRKSPMLIEKPLFQVLGQSTRFDVY